MAGSGNILYFLFFLDSFLVLLIFLSWAHFSGYTVVSVSQ